MNPFDLIEYQGRIEPEKPAIIAGNAIVTFGMLRAAANAVAIRIAAEGLPPGSIVALSVVAPSRHLAISMALARLGLVAAALPTGDVLGVLGAASLLIADQGTVPWASLPRLTATDDWFAPSLPEPTPPAHKFEANDPQRIIFSSGSTGLPKAVVCSALAMETHTDAVAFAFDTATGYRRLLTLMDLNSSLGLFTALAVLSRGRTLCFASGADEALRVISVYGCDYLLASVFQIRMVIDSQRRCFVPLPTLRAITTGGSIVPTELIAAAQSFLTQRIVLIYGSTEAGASAFAVADASLAEGDAGFIAPWMEIEAVDAEGVPVPPGTEGELRLHAEGLGWTLGDPPAPGEKQWFHPGDRGVVLPDGRLRLTGRVSEVINIGGVKIAPESIEATLLRFAGVRDAGVTALRGRDGVDAIAAAIVADGSVDFAALEAHCRVADELAVPERFVQVESLPRGPTGKLQRRLLTDLFDNEAGR